MKKAILFLLLMGLAANVFADADTITVTVASTEVVAPSYQRTSVIVKNIGTTTCYLTDEDTADTNDFEVKTGEIYVATERFAKRQINAIVSAGTTELRIWTGNN